MATTQDGPATKFGSVRLGQTQRDAIRSATIEAKPASNPLGEVTLLEHVSFVMKEGRVFDGGRP